MDKDIEQLLSDDEIIESINQTLTQMGIDVPELEVAKSDEGNPGLANIENALLTIAESIKYAADIYAEVHAEPPVKPDEDLAEVHPWRKTKVGDRVRLTGIGNNAVKAHKGHIATVTSVSGKQDYLAGIRCCGSNWGEINNEMSRLWVVE